MSDAYPAIYTPDEHALPYRALPDSTYRVKCTFRVDFTNGGHLYGEDFLLDIEGADITCSRLAEIIVSAMNLLRAGPVTIFSKQIVQRGQYQDGMPA